MPLWQILLIVWLIYAIGYNIALIRKPWCSRKTTPPSRGWGHRTRILIIGATGGTGRELVRQALEQGHQVTAFVRNPRRLKIEHSNLRVVEGNVLDYASVERAMQNQSAVLCALGHKRLLWPTRILSRGTENIMRAMQAARVPRLIVETALGVGDAVGRAGLPATLGFFPLVLAFYSRDRLRQEEVIAANNQIDWVIVRPPLLTNGPARGKYRHGDRVGNYLWPLHISRADVADFMLAQLHDDHYVGHTPAVAY